VSALSDVCYLGLFDPANVLHPDDAPDAGFHGIRTAAADIWRCIERHVPFGEFAFVSSGPYSERFEMSLGETFLTESQLPTWLGGKQTVIAHDLAVGNLHFNACRHLAGRADVPLLFTLHSMSYGKDMLRCFGEALRLPWYPWDRAAVSTNCGRVALEQIFHAAAPARAPYEPPAAALARIPVDTEFFSPGDPRPGRQASGCSQDDVVFLVAGRLNPDDKADLLPLLIAMRLLLAQQNPFEFRVVVAGWDYSGYADALEESARQLEVGTHLEVVRTPSREQLRDLYRAADVFLSLGDSVQETFGISTVEAMAVGLPVVASAWNGHRESVREGASGLLLPTIWGGNDLPASLMSMWERTHYLSHRWLSKQVAYSPAALASAMYYLACSPGRREAMGEEGRVLAHERHSYQSVGSQYASLFEQLATASRRGRSSLSGQLAPPFPYRQVFGHYAPLALDSSMVLVPGPADLGFDAFASPAEAPVKLGVRIEVIAETLRSVSEPISVRDVLQLWSEEDREEAARAILLCLKYGALLTDRLAVDLHE